MQKSHKYLKLGKFLFLGKHRKYEIFSKHHQTNVYNQAFTIVELLVVIVVIGVLAAITVVSYSGITTRAKIAAIQAELSGSSKKLAIYYAFNGSYPITIDNNGCPLTPVPDTINCIKFSGITEYDYTYMTSGTYELIATNGVLCYIVTENSTPIAYINPWIKIGTQMWSKANLNVGTRIDGVNNQTLAATAIEKYCYGDSEANCTTKGGLYQWDEAMQYATNERAQGICPGGRYIPSDDDWKTLEQSQGMTALLANTLGSRGVNQEGIKLQNGGLSGFNVLLVGYRGSGGAFTANNSSSLMWSSTQSVGDAYFRGFDLGVNTVYRGVYTKPHGFSVRCVKNL